MVQKFVKALVPHASGLSCFICMALCHGSQVLFNLQWLDSCGSFKVTEQGFGVLTFFQIVLLDIGLKEGLSKEWSVVSCHIHKQNHLFLFFVEVF